MAENQSSLFPSSLASWHTLLHEGYKTVQFKNKPESIQDCDSYQN